MAEAKFGDPPLSKSQLDKLAIRQGAGHVSSQANVDADFAKSFAPLPPLETLASEPNSEERGILYQWTLPYRTGKWDDIARKGKLVGTVGEDGELANIIERFDPPDGTMPSFLTDSGDWVYRNGEFFVGANGKANITQRMVSQQRVRGRNSH